MGHMGHGLSVDPFDLCMPGALGHLGHGRAVDPIDLFSVLARLWGVAGYGSNRSYCHAGKIGAVQHCIQLLYTLLLSKLISNT